MALDSTSLTRTLLALDSTSLTMTLLALDSTSLTRTLPAVDNLSVMNYIFIRIAWLGGEDITLDIL